MKKDTIRMCFLTRERKNKQDLIRLVKLNNLLIIDLDKSIKARGYYLIPDINIIKKAIKTGRIKKYLNLECSEKFYQSLITIALNFKT